MTPMSNENGLQTVCLDRHCLCLPHEPWEANCAWRDASASGSVDFAILGFGVFLLSVCRRHRGCQTPSLKPSMPLFNNDKFELEDGPEIPEGTDVWVCRFTNEAFTDYRCDRMQEFFAGSCLFFACGFCHIYMPYIGIQSVICQLFTCRSAVISSLASFLKSVLQISRPPVGRGRGKFVLLEQPNRVSHCLTLLQRF